MQYYVVVGKSNDIPSCRGNSRIQSRRPSLPAFKNVSDIVLCRFCEVLGHLEGIVVGIIVDNQEFPIKVRRQCKLREAFKNAA